MDDYMESLKELTMESLEALEKHLVREYFHTNIKEEEESLLEYLMKVNAEKQLRLNL